MQLRRSIALKAHPDKVPDFKLRGDQYYAFMSGGVAVQNAVLDLSTRDYQVMFYEPSYCRSFAIPFFCCCWPLDANFQWRVTCFHLSVAFFHFFFGR